MKTFAGILAAFWLVATGALEAQIASQTCFKPRSSFKRETEGGGLTVMKPCLRAKPVHPGVVVRGDSIEFNGSTSTGEIKKYKWTLAPKDCPDGPDEWTTADTNFTARILCSMSVTLEVSDGEDTDKQKTTVTVNARTWKTETSRLPADSSMGFVSTSMEFGKNRCQDKNHFQENPGDFIHFADNSNTWMDEAYWPKQVNGDGPFKGYWYVDSNQVRVVRKEFINSRLIDATSDVYRLNAEKGTLGDLKLIAQQVRMHERIHSDLMMEKLRESRDPAVEIERLLHRDFEELQKKADAVIGAVNSKIAEATTEQKVKARLGKMRQFNGKAACIFTVDGEKRCFPNLADIGDVPP